MAELEGSLRADKIQHGTTRRWVLTDVMLCTSQRLKEKCIFLKHIAKKKRKMKITRATRLVKDSLCCYYRKRMGWDVLQVSFGKMKHKKNV